MNLKYNTLWGFYNNQQMPHAQTVMKDLGITYRYAIPQAIADQWWFFNCANVPDPLPPYLSHFKSSPVELVGYGLSKEMAEDIMNHR